jgi:hypothetical protein
LVTAAVSASPAQHAENCDRDCLRGFITRYLDAMVSHDVQPLPVSNNVRFTEDTVAMKLGEGLWKKASLVRPYRQDIIDVRQGVAASQVVVEENGSPVMLMLRLKIADGRITEIETQVTRNQKDGAIFEVKSLQTPNKVMAEAPLKSELPSREEAIKLPSSIRLDSKSAVSLRLMLLSRLLLTAWKTAGSLPVRDVRARAAKTSKLKPS